MSDTEKRTRLFRGLGATAATLLFVGILVLAALIVQKHPLRKDLTETGDFTLTEQTRKIMASLTGEVVALAFFQEGQDQMARVKDLLETYRYTSRKFSYKFIDPVREPDITRRYQVRFGGTIILTRGDRWQTVSEKNEEGITNGLIKLMSEKEKTLYFLAGHGEKSVSDSGKDGYSGLKRSLEGENYQVRELNLLEKPQVPGDAALVVAAGPQKPFLKSEISALKKYLEKGGRLIVMLEPEQDGGLSELLDEYGVQIASDVVIDKMSQAMGGSYLIPVISSYGEHKITEGFKVAAFFPTARTVDMAIPPDGVEVTRLAFTSRGSWAETDIAILKKSGTATYSKDKDRMGPLSLSVVAAKGKSRLAVFGDSDFTSNSYFNLLANGDLILNTINYLAEEETKIAIKRPQKKGDLLVLTPTQGRLIFWLPMVAMPLIPLVAGLVVFLRRRRSG